MHIFQVGIKKDMAIKVKFDNNYIFDFYYDVILYKLNKKNNDHKGINFNSMHEAYNGAIKYLEKIYNSIDYDFTKEKETVINNHINEIKGKILISGLIAMLKENCLVGKIN